MISRNRYERLKRLEVEGTVAASPKGGAADD